MVDLLQAIIYRHGKLVGKQPVRTPDDKVSDRGCQLLLQRSLQAVANADFDRLHAHPDRAGTAPRGQPITASAGIDRSGFSQYRTVCNLPAAAPAVIEMALLPKPVKCCIIVVTAPALIADRAIPCHAQLFQHSDNTVAGTGDLARWVQVLDTQ